MSVSSVPSASLAAPIRAVRAEVGTATDQRREGEAPAPATLVVRVPARRALDAPLSPAFERYLDSLSDEELAALEELDSTELVALVDAIERPETRPLVRPAARLLHRVA
jgi:hypothetical protein